VIKHLKATTSGGSRVEEEGSGSHPPQASMMLSRSSVEETLDAPKSVTRNQNFIKDILTFWYILPWMFWTYI